jgi:hypothetical protein
MATILAKYIWLKEVLENISLLFYNYNNDTLNSFVIYFLPRLRLRPRPLLRVLELLDLARSEDTDLQGPFLDDDTDGDKLNWDSHVLPCFDK